MLHNQLSLKPTNNN